MYYIYILYSRNFDKFYCGYSENPWRRIVEHNNKPYNTYTRKYRPWSLMAVFEIQGDTHGINIERFIKKQKSRLLYKQLIDPLFQPVGYISQLVRVPHVRD